MQTFRFAVMAAAALLTATAAGAQPTGRPPAKAAAKPGETLKQCRNCPEMVVIPPGW